MPKPISLLAAVATLSLLQACPRPVPPAQPAPVTSPSDSTVPGRAMADRPDEVDGLQIHPIYVLPPGAPDEHLDISGAIHDSLMRVNAWFQDQTGGRKLRIDTYGGKADVTFHRLGAPVPSASDSEPVLSQVVTALQEAGLDHPQKVMLILYGDNLHTDWTGVGGNLTALVQIIPDGRWPAPKAIFDGLDKIVAHELLHALGAVPDGAPHRGDGFHATDDPHDVMTARADRSPPWILDVGKDDYYGHGRSDLHDLATSFYWDPIPANAAVWAGQPLALTDGPNPLVLPTATITSDSVLETSPMAVIQQWRQQAGQSVLPADDSLRRLLSRYLDGRLGAPDATSEALRFESLYAGDFHVWRSHGRLAPGGDPAALLTTMAQRALADGGDAIVKTALTGAGAVVRRQGDDLWLAIGVGTAPLTVQDLHLSEGPHVTYTLTGKVRRNPGSPQTLVRIGSDGELGYSLRLQEEPTPFAVSVPKDRALTLRLRTSDGTAWIGPALLSVDGRQPLAFLPPSPTAIDKPTVAGTQF